jgi:prepilin-type N-terminal cleavage/methylation domain-containing protein/prepilin-type processing-associated H-X9-DG protein
MKSERAFTLIELLFTVAIIALLAGLLIPAASSFLDRARDLKCQQNLRELFVFLSSAATDNDNRYPKIEIDIEKPSHAGDPSAKPLFETLQRYGCTEKHLQCPNDLLGPNWYAKKKTSYMWQPVAEDEPKNSITIYTPRSAFTSKLSRVRLLQDWDLVHGPENPGMRRRMQVLYADGHVGAR